jgi:hypothetical protein
MRAIAAGSPSNAAGRGTFENGQDAPKGDIGMRGARAVTLAPSCPDWGPKQCTPYMSTPRSGDLPNLHSRAPACPIG